MYAVVNIYIYIYMHLHCTSELMYALLSPKANNHTELNAYPFGEMMCWVKGATNEPHQRKAFVRLGS